MQHRQTDELRMLSMQDVAQILGVTRVTVYRSLIGKGLLDTFKVGTCRRATPAALDLCVERLEVASGRVTPPEVLPEVFGSPRD